MDREWKLDVDLATYDNLLDNVSFDALILAVHCNCKEITEAAVRKEWKSILDGVLSDARFLLDNNIDKIIEKAKEGRES